MDDAEQLTLPVPADAGSEEPDGVLAASAPGRATEGSTPGTLGPVARVVLDVALPHLDRPFDYAVPGEMAETAVPGARVSVRFAGRDTAGFVVARADHSDHPGRLTPLRRVVSPVPVLTAEVLAVARAVADHYAGTLSDVLRLAVPPRHARVETTFAADAGADTHAEIEGADDAGGAVEPDGTGEQDDAPETLGPAQWAAYDGGAAFVRRLAAGESPRAVWSALPDGSAGSRRAAIAAAVGATLGSGRGALVVVPDAGEVDRLGAALTAAGVRYARLVAEDGPAARYRAFLRVLNGYDEVVLGTRAAAFAPVRDLGLVAVWDDGDDLLAEPRSPYPHARTVLRIRAEVAGSAALVGGYARSTAAQQLLEDGWARAVVADRRTVRDRAPRVIAPDEADLAREGPGGHARIPHLAWDLVRSGLLAGPVLVQVPRAGYVPFTACARCRTPARCEHCRGPLRLNQQGGPASCSWCGRLATAWACPECGERRVRASRVGSTRTAEELGRAFPSVPVVVSGASAPDGVVDAVDGEPRLVVATPGAEPEAEGSYAAALLLDAAVTSGRPELWAGEEALRRWFGAAALVRGADRGGRVMLLGRGAPVPSQALVRWDPGGFAARELAERATLGFPPAVAIASVQGAPDAVGSFLAHVDPALDADVLGPVAVDAPDHAPGSSARPEGDSVVRVIVRLPRRRAAQLSRALSVAAAARSARKEPGPVRVQVEPVELW